jgi:hypothetical protein
MALTPRIKQKNQRLFITVILPIKELGFIVDGLLFLPVNKAYFFKVIGVLVKITLDIFEV